MIDEGIVCYLAHTGYFQQYLFAKQIVIVRDKINVFLYVIALATLDSVESVTYKFNGQSSQEL